MASVVFPTVVGATVTPPTDTIQVPAGSTVDHLISVGVPAVPPKADILIAIDTTGSMSASIAQAKTDAISIVTGVQGSVLDTQFAVVDFKDSSDGVGEYRVVSPMTSSSSTVQTAVNGLSAGGGGDSPEAHNLVFRNSYTPATGGAIGWRSGTKKIEVVISDAQPHGAGTAGLAGCTDTTADPHAYNTATELAGMSGTDRTLFMVRQAATATVTLPCYQSIAAMTGGLGVDSGTALGTQIVTLINGAFNGTTEVHMEVASASPAPAATGWISFSPSSIPAALTPSTQPFTAHVAVPAGTSPGAYTFDLKAVADGADIGHQVLTVQVPVTHLSDVPILVRAVSGSHGVITGRLHSTPNTSQDVSFYYNATCDPGGIGELRFWAVQIALDAAGDGQFIVGIGDLPSTGFITATAATVGGATSDPSACIALSPGNDSWPDALNINVTGGNATLSGAPGYAIDSPGQSRWYKFSVAPGSQVEINLSDLPADYDLVLFKDISKAYHTLTTQSDLNKLSAEFAGQAFTGQAFTGQAFTGQAFTGQAFTADTFSGQAFTGQAFTGQAFTGQAFTGQAFTGQAFTGQAFTGQAFTGQAFTGPAGTGQAFTAQAFTSAQTRSGLAVSAITGLGSEAITVNTWNESGDFYVRVTGRDGAFDPTHSFTLNVSQTGSSCAGVHPIGAAPGDEPDTGVKTVILTDSSRISGTNTERTNLATVLEAFADRDEVGGVVVDLADDDRIGDLNAQADARYACPYAKNLVANALKDIVDSYRKHNAGLAYVVLVGDDSTIPFFRYVDQSGLAPETGYIPPVAGTSASEASLRLGFTLSQDAYGAGTQISSGENAFPVPDLAVGRLVENAPEATHMLDVYIDPELATAGVVNTPTSSLVTGYDFLEDAANAVKIDLNAAVGTDGDHLISPNNTSPADGWTADQLKAKFLDDRHDITFLAGHFSAKSALAADFLTTMTTADLAASGADMRDTIVFSAGCHSGYNVVDADGVPANTDVLDWAQAFAQKGATFIGGTGYQYGDTDFVMYSEQIYSSFAHELRLGNGPVSVGQALVRAKQDYLRQTASLQGIDQKALLEATLFGLPMLSVDFQSGRIAATPDPSVVSPSDVPAGPGHDLGLKSAALDVTASLPEETQLLHVGAGTVTATYHTGPDGAVSSSPLEPTLPLVSKNVNVPGMTLRGVGFVGGTYQDSSVIPLTGAATWEFGTLHTPFTVPTFFPSRLATPNYFDALGGRDTRLMVTPAQHKSNGTADFTSTLRLYSSVSFKLFYSSNIASSGGLSPALASAPGVYDVSASETTPGTILVKAHVVGDPSAGIQETWVTWTGFDRLWHSLDLTQSSTDSTLWTGTIGVPNGKQATDIAFMLQAVNGVGLVGTNDNYARYFSVPPSGVAPNVTHVTLASANPTDGVFNSTVRLKATLTGASQVGSQAIAFTIGNVSLIGTTDSAGVAAVDFQLTPPPDDYTLRASFVGNTANASSSDTQPFTILTRAPNLSFDLSGLPGHTFGDGPFSVAGFAHTNSDGAITFDLGSSSLGCAVTSAGLVTLTGATSLQNLCTIEASVAATARYDAAGPVSATFAIGKATPNLALAVLPNRVNGTGPFDVHASATSNSPVAMTFATTTPLICSVNGSGTALTLIAAGSCTITVNQAFNGDFNAAGPVARSFTITNPVPIVTGVLPGSTGRGAVDFPLTITGTGFVPGATATISGTGVTVKSTTYVNSTHVTAVVSVATNASTTNRNVSVGNLGTAAGTCAGCLGINQGPYGIVAVPTSIGRGAVNENVSVVGFNFVSGTWTPSSVQFSGAGITVNSVTRVNSFLLTVSLSVASTGPTGAGSVTVVNPDGGRSTALAAFTLNAAPTITSLSPSSRGQGATRENVVITGSNFGSGSWPASSVSFSGSPSGITVNSVTRTDATHLTVNVSIAAGATTGPRNVSIRNLDGGRTTNAGAFSVNSGPGLVSVAPPSRGQGATGQTIVVTGSNFATGAWPASAVVFSGSGVTVNSVSRTDASHLSVNISVATNAPVGTRSLTLRNPSDGGIAALASALTVTPRPTIASLNPGSRSRGQSNQNIVITGTGFASGASVAFSGSGINVVSVTFTDAGHITVKISVASNAATGNRSVTVTNPDQGWFTLNNGLKVT
jgi:hypothetical protein